MNERRERRLQVRARGRNIARRERVPEQALAVRDDEIAVAGGAQPEQRVRQAEQSLGHLGHRENSGESIARTAPDRVRGAPWSA